MKYQACRVDGCVMELTWHNNKGRNHVELYFMNCKQVSRRKGRSVGNGKSSLCDPRHQALQPTWANPTGAAVPHIEALVEQGVLAAQGTPSLTHSTIALYHHSQLP